MEDTLENQQININPETIEEMTGRHIVVSNNGADFAIYVKEDNNTVGRIFVSMAELTEITNQFIKTVLAQGLDPDAICVAKISNQINQ